MFYLKQIQIKTTIFHCSSLQTTSNVFLFNKTTDFILKHKKTGISIFGNAGQT